MYHACECTSRPSRVDVPHALPWRWSEVDFFSFDAFWHHRIFNGKSPAIKTRVFQSKTSSRNSATKGAVNARFPLVAHGLSENQAILWEGCDRYFRDYLLLKHQSLSLPLRSRYLTSKHNQMSLLECRFRELDACQLKPLSPPIAAPLPRSRLETPNKWARQFPHSIENRYKD